jgi:predicted PurR-regulated permease PerM
MGLTHTRCPFAAGKEPAMSTDDRSRAALAQRTLWLLLLAVTLALGWILLPFYGSIMWGGIIAMLFAPVYRRLLARLGRRRTPAALLTLLLVLLIVVLPFALLSAALAREAGGLYQRIESGELQPGLYFRGLYDALPAWATGLLDRAGLIDFDTLQRQLSTSLASAARYLATQAFSIGQDTFAFLAALLITLYLAFFLVRDGDALAALLRRAVPLTPQHMQELTEKFTTVIRATVKGSLVVAVVQGTLGGLAFWALGVGAPLLWAVLMAFLSLVPAVGSALVWAPVALYFLASGDLWRGGILAAYGVLVIGLVDNLLRPLLVGKDTRMPDYVVMITTLGGMAALGVNGFVIGPAIAAMAMAVWHLMLTQQEPRP